MTVFSMVPFVAALLSLLLATGSVLQNKLSRVRWLFFAGMVLLALDSLLTGLSLRATLLPEALRWLTLALIAKSFLPGAWLAFSLMYSRGNSRASLARWRIPLAVFALLPVGLAVGFKDGLLQVVAAGPSGEAIALRFGLAARILNVVLLVSLVLVLRNLEQTFRSAVGTMRWRIKYIILGLAVIFGAHLYVRSQAILFSRHDPALSGAEPTALLIGCSLLLLAYVRAGFAEAEVYPSRAALRSSLTILLAGGYLFVVGVLAQVVKRFGGAEGFQFQAFVVLVGMVGLAVLLLSDRLRQRLRAFVVRHFRRAQHDSARIWTRFSQQLGAVKDEAGLCAAAARLTSETFEVLSTTVWLMDGQDTHLVMGASTAPQAGPSEGSSPSGAASGAVADGLLARTSPFDLDAEREAWAEEMRRLNPAAFQSGGHRWCVPLRAGDECLGALVLADRVNGVPYSVEEVELLGCIADQVTSVLLNLRLAGEVARARELEAFRTMSAFFVHDLKNAAASLNLMLRNLPAHFDDPAFREDALRGVGNTARRIDDMINRLSALRQRPDFKPIDTDVSELVREAVGRMDDMPGVELTMELQALPRIPVDREQFRSVVANLLLNARDAVSPGGRIEVRTERSAGRVVVSVADNGCGMSQEFVRESLFRPFQSTKKSGLGIGMFQSRMIVEAHRGTIHVESEPGRGTTVRVSLPARDAP